MNGFMDGLADNTSTLYKAWIGTGALVGTFVGVTICFNNHVTTKKGSEETDPPSALGVFAGVAGLAGLTTAYAIGGGIAGAVGSATFPVSATTYYIYQRRYRMNGE